MILFGNILYALAKIIELADGLLTVYKYMLIAAALISWVNPDPYNPIVSFLHRLRNRCSRGFGASYRILGRLTCLHWSLLP